MTSSSRVAARHDVIMTLLALFSAVTSSVCPHHCSCHDDVTGGRRVDCRDRMLSDVIAVLERLPVDAVELDIGSNRISGLVDWTSFSSSASLKRLSVDKCQLRRISRHGFHGLTSLEYLDLSHNEIVEVSSLAFDGLASLHTLKLEFNRINGLSAMTFTGLTLHSLQLHNNNITDINTETFRGSRVESLNLDGNHMTSLTRSQLRPLQTSLQNISVSHNAVPLGVSPEAFEGFSFKSLRIISSGLSSLSFLENVASVEELEVGGNPLGSDITLEWSNALALGCRVARLNDIGLSQLDSTLLSSLRSVHTLDLSGNLLATLNAEALRNLPELRHLDLSRNMLARLPGEFSLYVPRLESLNLSANSLVDLPAQSLGQLSRFRLIDLSNNKLQFLHQTTFTSTLTSSLMLNVTGNPLHCNCELQWLHTWFQTFSSMSSMSPAPHCSTPRPAPLLNLSNTQFRCSAPIIQHVTRSTNVREGSDVILSCTSDSDPASATRWTSPAGDVMAVTPSTDRLQRRLSAIWQIRRARVYHTGWYRCDANNSVGNSSAFTYLHVMTPSTPPVELSQLVYPAIPAPVSSSSTVTSYVTSFPAEIQVDTTLTSETVFSSAFLTSDLTSAATEMTSRDVLDVTSSESWKAPTELMFKSLPGDSDVTYGNIIIILLIVLLTASLLLFVAILIYFRRRSGKYVTSHPVNSRWMMWSNCAHVTWCIDSKTAVTTDNESYRKQNCHVTSQYGSSMTSHNWTVTSQPACDLNNSVEQFLLATTSTNNIISSFPLELKHE